MRKFLYSCLKALPMATSIWAYLAGAAIAMPITVHEGDTLGVKFRFESPFLKKPNSIGGSFVEAPGTNNYNNAITSTTLFNGNTQLGSAIFGNGGGAGGFFIASQGGWTPGPSPIHVDFSSIRNRTIDGRIKTKLISKELRYDPALTPFGYTRVNACKVPFGGGGCAPEFAKVLSVTLNGRNIWNAIPGRQTAPPISSFPTPPTLFSNISSFITSNISSFAQESQEFLNSQIIALGNALAPNKSVKDAANAVATAIDDSANVYAVGSAFLKPTEREALQSLTEWFLQKQVAGLVGDDVTAGNLNFVYDTTVIGLTQLGNPALALFNVNMSIYSNLLSPQLHILANDPFDPDYQSVISVNDPVFLNIPTTGNVLLDENYSSLLSSGAEAYLFLRAVNISFDRYTAAYSAGDPESTALQFEAILFYLDQFYSALGESGELLGLVRNGLINAGTADIEFDHDGAQALLDHYLYGLTSDEIDNLLGLGFTLEDIDLVKSELASVDLTQFQGSLFGGMSQLSEEFRVGAIGDQTNSVPEPGTLFLLGSGLLGLARLRRAPRGRYAAKNVSARVLRCAAALTGSRGRPRP